MSYRRQEKVCLEFSSLSVFDRVLAHLELEGRDRSQLAFRALFIALMYAFLVEVKVGLSTLGLFEFLSR
ncbi:hypothetical protein DERP_014381 [Dermatophagoides pteronyssinus]|uniref:Uncharacterized protein n=1 Tax=Dermatophagoides pteronyssinus TaxID=6956 RepID=A0ABQ8J5R9_DERPT|nr:hypothetical protein DERP_014381 [Dermatophagoides pteronyssinus]